MGEALQRFIANFKGTLADAIIDSWFIVDDERNLVEWNGAFFSLLPRQTARSLTGKKCFEVLELDICKDRCIAEQCWQGRRQIRLDEISGRPKAAESDKPMRFVLSAMPIYDEAGKVVGALEIQRNVTDEAEVQSKYQAMLDEEARERERLLTQIRLRTRELVESNDALLKAQSDLVSFKKGLSV